MQVGAGEALFFQLDAHAIMLAARQVRKRIAAQDRRRAGLNRKAKDHELSGQCRRQGVAVSGHEDKRKHAVALPVYARHPHGTKPRPRGRRAHGDEAGISLYLPFTGALLQQRLKGAAPASRERRDAQGAFELSAGNGREDRAGHPLQRLSCVPDHC